MYRIEDVPQYAAFRQQFRDLKTAKALGIKIPQSIQLRADRVIE